MQNNILTCSCQESCFEGIPCRHELCVYAKGSKQIANLNFQKRWSKNYFDVAKLPKVELEDEEEDLIENLSQELNGYEENDGQNLTEITTIKKVLFS